MTIPRNAQTAKGTPASSVPPLYVPESKIRTGLFTAGKEWMIDETKTEYVGEYHQYTNDATFTGAAPSPSAKALMPYAPQFTTDDLVDEEGISIGVQSANNTDYYRLTEIRFNKHTPPEFYYPSPTESDYKAGVLTRYFLQRKNDRAELVEVSKSNFKGANLGNTPGPDLNLYDRLLINWVISGDVQMARKTNLSSLRQSEVRMPGITNYLSDLDEFHKDRHKIPTDEITNGLYTPGGEFETAPGVVYQGSYHIHKGVAMVGASHVAEEHAILYPIGTAPSY